MRNLCAVVLSASLLATSAFAASGSDGVLAPGKPAGIKQAQSGSTVALILAGTAALAMVAAMVGGGGSGSLGANNQPNGGSGGATTTT